MPITRSPPSRFHSQGTDRDDVARGASTRVRRRNRNFDFGDFAFITVAGGVAAERFEAMRAGGLVVERDGGFFAVCLDELEIFRAGRLMKVGEARGVIGSAIEMDGIAGNDEILATAWPTSSAGLLVVGTVSPNR